MAREVAFLSGCRIPFGAFCGALREVTATNLAAHVARAAIERAGIGPEDVDHVVFGNVIQSSKDACYLARHAALKAGVPERAPAVTVNRLCASGFEAIVEGAKQILLGESEFVLVGGAENMSQAPHVIRNTRWGIGLGQTPMEDALWSALTDALIDTPMAITAENLAEKYGITREAADQFAYESQMKTKAGWESGRLAEECVPLEVKSRKGTVRFERDEHPRPETTPEGLSKLKPYFKEGGVVTAGNASGITDGAAALVVASGEAARARGLRPIGRLLSWAAAGCEPRIMGIGPAPASRRALERAGMALGEMDLIEINEAFAAQYLAVEKELGLDRSRVNVNGGAVAIGHPLGASGARLTLTLLHELRRRGGHFGLASACVGGGQGMSLVVEALGGE